MRSDYAARGVYDLAGLRRSGLEPLDDVAVAALRHEADVLAVRLVGHFQAELESDLPHFALGLVAQGKAQHGELRGSGRKQKIALVARKIDGAVKLRSVTAHDAADI